jgi:hypothetical protein
MRFIIINEFWFTWFKFKDRKVGLCLRNVSAPPRKIKGLFIYLFLPWASYNFEFLFIIFYLNTVDIPGDPPTLLVRARKISFIFFHLSNCFYTFIVKLRLIINNIHYLFLSSGGILELSQKLFSEIILKLSF